MAGRGGRYGSIRVIGMVFLCARRGVPLCRCWPPASPSSRSALSLGLSCFFYSGYLSCRAHRCSHTPCLCFVLLSALPLLRRPVPSASVRPFLPSSPPIRCHSEGSDCTFPSTITSSAVHSPMCANRGFHVCPTLLSLPLPLVSGRTLTLPALMCYRPPALCYVLLPRMSPLPRHHWFTLRGGVNMRTGLWSCLWTA